FRMAKETPLRIIRANCGRERPIAPATPTSQEVAPPTMERMPSLGLPLVTSDHLVGLDLKHTIVAHSYLPEATDGASHVAQDLVGYYNSAFTYVRLEGYPCHFTLDEYLLRFVRTFT